MNTNLAVIIQRLITLCIGLSLGVLAAGGPSPPVSSKSGAETHTTATRPLYQARPKVVRKGPEVKRPPAPTEKQVTWLARAMWAEAYKFDDMVHVGQSVRNRILSDQHPNTVKAIVTEDWAYTGIHLNQRNVRSLTLKDYRSGPPKWDMAVRAAYFTLILPRRLLPMSSTEITHYLSPHMMGEKHTWPQWAQKKPHKKLGRRFAFFKDPGQT